MIFVDRQTIDENRLTIPVNFSAINVHSTIFPPFGRGNVDPARNSGVVGKICHYIVSTKQKSSRIRTSRALNGGPEGRAGGKIRHFLRKVVEKVGERYRDTDEHIGIRSTRAFREPCNGGFSPRTPITNGNGEFSVLIATSIAPPLGPCWALEVRGAAAFSVYT